MYLNDVFTIPTNLAGHAAMSVPFGTGEGGLPIGVQVLANALGRGDDVPRRARARARGLVARGQPRQNAVVILLKVVGGFPLEEVTGVRDEQRAGAVEARGRGLPRERRQHHVVLGPVEHERGDRRLLEQLGHVLHRAVARALLVHAPARAQLVGVGVRLGVERDVRRR